MTKEQDERTCRSPCWKRDNESHLTSANAQLAPLWYSSASATYLHIIDQNEKEGWKLPWKSLWPVTKRVLQVS